MKYVGFICYLNLFSSSLQLKIRRIMYIKQQIDTFLALFAILWRSFIMVIEQLLGIYSVSHKISGARWEGVVRTKEREEGEG